LIVRPAQQRRDKLQDLELLRVRPVECEEVQKVVRHELAVDHVLWLSLAEEAQGLCEVVVEDDGLVSEFADEEVLLLDFLLEGGGAIELGAGGGEGFLGLF